MEHSAQSGVPSFNNIVDQLEGVQMRTKEMTIGPSIIFREELKDRESCREDRKKHNCLQKRKRYKEKMDFHCG